MAQAITWKFDKSYDFYKDLAMRESSGNHTLDFNSRNPKKTGGHIGLYQFGEQALVDAEYYIKPTLPGRTKPNYNDDWTGTWTGKNGVYNRADFLASREVQEIAVREYHRIVWEERGYLGNYRKFEGTNIGGITLTKAGMIAASHLLGAGELIKFIKSNGTLEIAKDGLRTTLTEYLKGFSDPKYQVDYSTQELQRVYDERRKAEADIEDQEEEATEDNSAFTISLGANKVMNDMLSDPVKLKKMQERALREAEDGRSSFEEKFPGYGSKVAATARKTAPLVKELQDLAFRGPTKKEKEEAASWLGRSDQNFASFMQTEEGGKE